MKTYIELSGGKWLVTDNEIITQNGEFLLIPLSKGLGSSAGAPTLICDCNDATTLWNGKGFVVTLPVTNTTHSFTLVWGDLTRTFQLIVSNRDFSGEIDQLQNEKLAFDNYIQLQDSQFKNFISSIENDIYHQIDSINLNMQESIESSFRSTNNLNQQIKNVIEMYENSATANAEDLRNQINVYPHMATVYNAMISVFLDQASKFNHIRTEIIEKTQQPQFESTKASIIATASSAIIGVKNNISILVNEEKHNLNNNDIAIANLRSQQVNIVPIDSQFDNVKGTLGPVCTFGNITVPCMGSLSELDSNISESQLQQENEDQKRTIADLLNERSKLSAHAQILQNIILNNENMFHLVDEGGGVYSYELNPRINLPNNLPISYSYFLFSGPNTYISSRCPLVWTDERGDESGKEVIRNFSCTFDRYRLVICNQDNDTYRGNHDVLMYSGNTDVNDQKIVPQRLIGEGFFAISVTACIGNYSYTSDIPVCISGNPNYAPVGGTVVDLQDKIMKSGFPNIDTSS